MKKEVEKAIENLRDVCIKNECKVIMAVTDKKSMTSTFQGSLLDIANLIANFKKSDNDFVRALKLASLISDEKDVVGSLAKEMVDMMLSSERMETKDKSDC